MKQGVQIAVLIIYLFTSSFLVGVNNWSNAHNSPPTSYADTLFEMFVFALCNSSEEGKDIPVLIKDPSDESTLIFENTYNLVISDFKPYFKQNHPEDKIKDPFRNIFSPPPQFI